MIHLKMMNGEVRAFGDRQALQSVTGLEVADQVLTEAEWRNAGYIARLVNGRIVLGPPEASLKEAKASKMAVINTAADKAIAALTATYPDREIATFDKQEAEARAHATNPTAPTPLLSALSQARGVPLDELARRVLVKAAAFAVASGSIIGQRQALEDRLDACTTVEEVEALAVTIVMPGAEAGA